MQPHWLIGLATLPLAYLARKLRKDPQFGAAAGSMKYVKKQGSVAWSRGSFRNLEKTPIQEDLGNLFGDLIGYIKASHTQPKSPLPVSEEANDTAYETGDFITWYGHSAFRLNTNGKTILVDPMLGDWVAPVPFLGHRFPCKDYNPMSDLGTIDLVVYSHDHYDHLDYDTFLQLKDNVKHYLCPLGVGAHLRAWGVPDQQITEVDWWQSVTLAGCQWTATPARHFSGRSPGTRNKSLWAGFVIQSPNHRIFFSGDSGYGKHFSQIGQQLGPFDLTILDSGQYHGRWPHVHMTPEEALRANQELTGKALLPVHWGAFSLSDHSWFDPVVRITEADREDKVITPLIGECFSLDHLDTVRKKWWETPTDQQGVITTVMNALPSASNPFR